MKSMGENQEKGGIEISSLNEIDSLFSLVRVVG